MNLHQIETLYNHHLSLYQIRRFTEMSAYFNLELCNLYGLALIRADILTQEEHELNKLPLVDFKKLLEQPQTKTKQ